MKAGFNLIYIVFLTIIGYSKNEPIDNKIRINPYLKYRDSLKKISIKNLIKVVSNSNDNVNYREVIFNKY
jgi:hypothetical protein